MRGELDPEVLEQFFPVLGGHRLGGRRAERLRCVSKGVGDAELAVRKHDMGPERRRPVNPRDDSPPVLRANANPPRLRGSVPAARTGERCGCRVIRIDNRVPVSAGAAANTGGRSRRGSRASVLTFVERSSGGRSWARTSETDARWPLCAAGCGPTPTLQLMPDRRVGGVDQTERRPTSDRRESALSTGVSARPT